MWQVSIDLVGFPSKYSLELGYLVVYGSVMTESSYHYFDCSRAANSASLVAKSGHYYQEILQNACKNVQNRKLQAGPSDARPAPMLLFTPYRAFAMGMHACVHFTAIWLVMGWLWHDGLMTLSSHYCRLVGSRKRGCLGRHFSITFLYLDNTGSTLGRCRYFRCASVLKVFLKS